MVVESVNNRTGTTEKCTEQQDLFYKSFGREQEFQGSKGLAGSLSSTQQHQSDVSTGSYLNDFVCHPATAVRLEQTDKDPFVEVISAGVASLVVI